MSQPKKRQPMKRYTLGPGMSLVLIILILLLSSYFKSADQAGPGESADLQGTQAAVIGQDQPLQVYFLNIGQGDSELVRIPDDTSPDGIFNMLIDTGEYKYADGLTDYLRDLGIQRIDALICSHPHTDHMGCMARIVERFDIVALYMPMVPDGMAPTTSAYEKLLDDVLEKGLTITPLHEDAKIKVPEGVEIQVMAPREDADWDDLNNWSAVIRLAYGESSFLFTGDAEKQSEAILLEDGYNPQADVLKCGHHGSSTSTSAVFLTAVDPQYAVISCGPDNRYGHPHHETVEALDAAGIKAYRTDQDGTILAETTGDDITFSTGLDPVQGKD